MKKLSISIAKKTYAEPVVDLLATVTMDNIRSLSTLSFRKGASISLSDIVFPDYETTFGLNKIQANDLKVVLLETANKFVNGCRDAGYRSLLPTSQECKLTTEISWVES